MNKIRPPGILHCDRHPFESWRQVRKRAAEFYNIGKGLKFLGFAQSSERMNGGHPVEGYYIKFSSEV